MTDLPVLPSATMDAAVQGAYCPKMCSFACPVHAATGRDDAVPWSFHRAVTDLAHGRRDAQAVADDLVACTGCLACQVPCAFDQDVPAQVRDARAVARPTSPAADQALDNLAAGRRPDGGDDPTATTNVPDGATVLHVGCHDPAEVVDAARTLLAAAGLDVAVVADGCCGQLARDLGDPVTADDRAAHRATQLAGAARVVTLDPHCAPALPDDLAVHDLWSVLADADLAWDDGAPSRTVAYHDPCLLARRDGVVDAPRALLAAAGVTVADPEFAGRETACSGAGMGLPLVDAGAADATARRRVEHLDATDAPATTTACSRAADRLRAAGRPTDDLVVLLASRVRIAP